MGHVAREASEYLIECGYVWARTLVDEIARRLMQRGFLPDCDSIKFLTSGEIQVVFDNDATREEVHDIVRTRAQARPRTVTRWWASATSGS